ncbi:MAG: class I SAM-dependent methyltransferase [Acidobacteriota bacterium]
MTELACRFCSAPLQHVFVDLGMSPLANSYRDPAARLEPEVYYPLCTYVCGECFLVQLPEVQTPEQIFRDYAYFSSYSESWLRHSERYVEAMIDRFGFGAEHQVVEVASNDGYLLQYFQRRGVPVLGIEPAENVAAAARELGIETLTEFFGTDLARRLVAEGRQADLLLGNNVFAHTPALNDFAAGLPILLAPHGVVTLEFPHLQRLIERNQFDTIYHEHYSYFSFTVARRVLAQHGLTVFDVEELPTHGGSLRIYARHADVDLDAAAGLVVTDAVDALLEREHALGLSDVATYTAFGERVKATKRRLLDFLIRTRESSQTVVGYGAPAKGNTMLVYCGIGPDMLDFTVDRSPHKQGKLLPGSQIPILAPDAIRDARPDVVLILPWNLRDEIIDQMADIRSWGGRFAVAVPEMEVIA